MFTRANWFIKVEKYLVKTGSCDPMMCRRAKSNPSVDTQITTRRRVASLGHQLVAREGVLPLATVWIKCLMSLMWTCVTMILSAKNYSKFYWKSLPFELRKSHKLHRFRRSLFPVLCIASLQLQRQSRGVNSASLSNVWRKNGFQCSA